MALSPPHSRVVVIWLAVAAVGSLTLVSAKAIAAGAITLADGTAVALADDGVLYVVDLDNATLTIGPTATGVGIVGALEADPTAGEMLALEIDPPNTIPSGRALSLSPDSGEVTVVKNDYVGGLEFYAVTRTPTGGHIVAYKTGANVGEVASLAEDGVLSNVQAVNRLGAPARVAALAYASDALWAFVEDDEQNIYPLDSSTGVLGTPLRFQQEVGGGLQDLTTLPAINAADSTADDTVYFVTSDGSEATLYRLELVTNSPTVAVVTLVGVLTVSGTTTTPNIGGFAIATLLDAERPGDDNRGSTGQSTPRTNQNATPATDATSVTLAETGVAGVWVAGVGVLALVAGIALASARRPTEVFAEKQKVH
jgi:hypothetical protein